MGSTHGFRWCGRIGARVGNKSLRRSFRRSLRWSHCRSPLRSLLVPGVCAATERYSIRSPFRCTFDLKIGLSLETFAKNSESVPSVAPLDVIKDPNCRVCFSSDNFELRSKVGRTPLPPPPFEELYPASPSAPLPSTFIFMALYSTEAIFIISLTA